MSLVEFKKGLSEEYQGEVIGEVFFGGLLERFDSPEHRYKLATLLQLETETKARLRPAALELGVELAEFDESRKLASWFYQQPDQLGRRRGDESDQYRPYALYPSASTSRASSAPPVFTIRPSTRMWTTSGLM